MIIRETAHEFIMISQHEHARLSGQIATYFKKEFFAGDEYVDDVLLAVYEHDRSWIGLDETPIWNDHKNQPASFMDYPLLPKLAFYTSGINETEEISIYAALLCSLHYTSFYSDTDQKHILPFLDHERHRQSRIMKILQHISEKTIFYHFRLLQFCDDLSLYVCLNEPGTRKENEHPWYKSGIKNSEIFSFNNQPIIARWLDAKKISLESFPFENEFFAQIKCKRVSKEVREKEGIDIAWRDTAFQEQVLQFVRRP